MAKGPRVFDSWALLALLEGEPAGDKVKSLLVEAASSRTFRWITTVNLGEVWYGIARRRSEAEADRLVAGFRDAGFTVIDADWTLARQAAHFKTRYKIAYADCLAAAAAKQREAELVTGDPEFRQLEAEVKIHWL